jgi:hypothetical protein
MDEANREELRRLTKQVQEISGVPEDERDGVWGLGSARAVLAKFKTLGLEPSAPKPNEQGDGIILSGDGTWPFTARVVGDDIVCENIEITCFGGWGGGNNADPQDSGRTASGKNTKRDWIEGVSIAMDSRQFPGMEANDSGGFRALKGAPFPKMPWGTLVEVTIGEKTFTPKDGIVDLGPGKQASKPGHPHALDLTPPAAQLFDTKTPIRRLAIGFSARGSFRIIGGAKYVRAS